ncbi:MAG: hypothetical protein R3298_00100 [Gammaproteobacteria bacterium]|nr:hypothetical protein [Gammaproteobacteria bacterium]
MPQPPQLQFPTVNEFENPTFERRESTVRRWAADLPVLNLVKTVPELRDQLPLLVSEPLAAGEKLRLLEHFRGPVNSVVAAAENRRLRQIPISSSVRKRIKDDVLALCYDMANGYKAVMQDLFERDRRPDSDKSLHFCIQRTLEQLRNALMHSFRIYRAVPPKHYQQMHQLHLYADMCGVATKQVADDDHTPAEDRTPQLVYLRAMLLAVADPFRLVDGAIEELYQFLARHGQSCRIVAGIAGDAHSDGLFLLRTESDLPPALFGRAQLDRAGEAPYTLDARPLMELLNQPAGSTDEPLETYAKWLLPRFKVAWERSQPRRQVDKKARVAGGLEAAAYLLSPAGRQSLASTGSGDRFGIEVQEIDDEQAVAHTLERWQVVNESLNGFMLRHPVQTGLGLRVGDLALIIVEREDRVQMQPVITVVRWFGVKDRNMQCGVEILPGHPVAVALESVLPNPEVPSGPGLYLPGIKSIQVPPSLVAPHGMHKPLRNLRVDLGTKKQVVSCGEVLTATEYFTRFRFGRA